ncbi:WD40 repeat-like protein [Exidia glandulosa HHB12029]|uniref:DNA damage-binding protein CMR1 n=1 Tax=Exidia glandulosa HHB12029 TaxID=1314781 RepID=A0A165EBV9_EXIGL|nr:WD40 repeat-like protein [Exidia glandulosa HHB12029]
MPDFEKLREENLAKNRVLLAELELENTADALGVPKATPKTKAKPVQPRKPKRKAEEDAPTPRRASTRLKRVNVDPNETPEQKRQREAEAEEQRRKDEEAQWEADEKARAAKRPRHEQLDLTILGSDLSDEDLVSLRQTLRVTCDLKQPKLVGDESMTWDDKETEDRDLGALKDAIKSMRVVSRAKVTQDRIYSMAYHPERSKDLIFFGDKHGQLGVWDARAPAEEHIDDDGNTVVSDEGGRYWRLQMHWPATSKSSISSIKFDPIDAHSLFTTAYDCTVRQWSFTSGASREVISFGDTLVTGLDLPPQGNELWISDALGGLTHMDLRAHKSQATRYEIAQHKIGSISVNPTNPFALLTASNSRYLKLWDARKLAQIPVDSVNVSAPVPATDEEYYPRTADFDDVETFIKSSDGKGTLKGEWQHGQSCSSAYWNPTGRFIVSTSYDDKLRYWNVWPDKLRQNGVLASFRPSGHIDHDCQTGRWLTVFKAVWSPNPDAYPHFTVGNMKHSLDIVTFKGDVVGRLQDKSKITAVQAVTASHPSILARAASGNGSGRCVLWADVE